jgi:hypothetical protein
MPAKGTKYRKFTTRTGKTHKLVTRNGKLLGVREIKKLNKS